MKRTWTNMVLWPMPMVVMGTLVLYVLRDHAMRWPVFAVLLLANVLGYVQGGLAQVRR